MGTQNSSQLSSVRSGKRFAVRAEGICSADLPGFRSLGVQARDYTLLCMTERLRPCMHRKAQVCMRRRVRLLYDGGQAIWASGTAVCRSEAT